MPGGPSVLCPPHPLAAPSSKAPLVLADLPANGGLPEYRQLSPFTAPSPVQVLAQFLFFNPPFVLPGFCADFLTHFGNSEVFCQRSLDVIVRLVLYITGFDVFGGEGEPHILPLCHLDLIPSLHDL